MNFICNSNECFIDICNSFLIFVGLDLLRRPYFQLNYFLGFMHSKALAKFCRHFYSSQICEVAKYPHTWLTFQVKWSIIHLILQSMNTYLCHKQATWRDQETTLVEITNKDTDPLTYGWLSKQSWSPFKTYPQSDLFTLFLQSTNAFLCQKHAAQRQLEITLGCVWLNVKCFQSVK